MSENKSQNLFCFCFLLPQDRVSLSVSLASLPGTCFVGFGSLKLREVLSACLPASATHTARPKLGSFFLIITYLLLLLVFNVNVCVCVRALSAALYDCMPEEGTRT